MCLWIFFFLNNFIYYICTTCGQKVTDRNKYRSSKYISAVLRELFTSPPASPEHDSEVRRVTSGCWVAGVRPGPHPPRQKEMEQEIGLVSLVPPLVSLSDPLRAPRTHSETHKNSPRPPLIAERPGTARTCARVCLCLFESRGLELWSDLSHQTHLI